MHLATERYEVQRHTWPSQGQHILAHYDDSSVIVYQAYRHAIGQYAVQHGQLGGPGFSLARMSWIKPGFLWMMHRSGWGSKEDQQTILGLRIRRTFFEQLLSQAVPSSCPPDYPGGPAQWQRAVGQSKVRLQWDPDHAPAGAHHPHRRRALQLGLRGSRLADLAGPELLQVIDLSDFVAAQRVLVQQGQLEALRLPIERVYPWQSPLS